MDGADQPLLSDKKGRKIKITDQSSRIEMGSLYGIELRNVINTAENQKLAAKFDDKFKDGNISDLDDCQKIWTFLNFFIPDWDNMSSAAISYDLLAKSEIVMAKTGVNLFMHIANLLSRNEKSFFHPFAFEILCQFFGELILAKNMCAREAEDQTREDEMTKFLIKFDHLESFLGGLNEDYQALFKLMIVFCTYSTEKHNMLIRTNTTDEHLELLYFLRMSFIAKFERKLVEILENDEEKLGSFSRIALQPIMKFFIFIAEQQEQKCFVRLIVKKFPHLEGNSYRSLRNRTPVTVYFDDAKYESEIMKIFEVIKAPRDTFRFRSVDKSLDKLLSLKKDLKEIMFGRNIRRPESLFEAVLSVTGIGSANDSCTLEICNQLSISKSPSFLLDVR